MRKLRVYGMGTQNNGCSFYRIWQPVEMLGQLGLADVDRELDEPRLVSPNTVNAIFEWADVVHTQPMRDLWAVSIMLAARDHQRKKLVLDLDDDIFNLNPVHIGVKDGKIIELHNEWMLPFDDMWQVIRIKKKHAAKFAKRLDGSVLQDSKNGKWYFLRQKYYDTQLSAQTLLQHVDLITTTTPYLKARLEQYTKVPIVCLPNCINLAEWDKHANKRKIDSRRFGWCGSVSHYSDFPHILPALDSAVSYGGRATVLGSSFDYMFPPKPGAPRYGVEGYGKQHNITYIDLEQCDSRWPDTHFRKYVPIQRFVEWFNTEFDAAIGIAPLADTEFNKCKSELKWSEYATLGRPTVASGFENSPYQCIEHGVDGFLCASVAEWQDNLQRLLKFPQEGAQVGAAARKRIEAHYDALLVAPRWLDAYKTVL